MGRRAAADHVGGCFQQIVAVLLLQLVGLGHNDLIGHGALIEPIHTIEIVFLHPVARIDQKADAAQGGAPPQIKIDHIGPARGFGLRHFGVAIAGHIDQQQFFRQQEEVELLGSPRRVGRACQRIAPG